MTFSYLLCLYYQSMKLTKYFSPDLFNKTDISWKRHLLFSLSDWQLPPWWIVYKMNTVSPFQMTGLCGLLFISFVCCDLKCRIYFSLVLLWFSFLVSWKKINRTFTFTRNSWAVLQTLYEFLWHSLWTPKSWEYKRFCAQLKIHFKRFVWKL